MLMIEAIIEYDTGRDSGMSSAKFEDGNRTSQLRDAWSWIMDRFEGEDADNITAAYLQDEGEEANVWLWTHRFDRIPPARNPTTATRAEGARRIVGLYCDEPEDIEQSVSDLVSDLMHLCDKEGVDWHKVMRRAIDHYCDEKREELQFPPVTAKA